MLTATSLETSRFPIWNTRQLLRAMCLLTPLDSRLLLTRMVRLNFTIIVDSLLEHLRIKTLLPLRWKRRMSLNEPKPKFALKESKPTKTSNSRTSRCGMTRQWRKPDELVTYLKQRLARLSTTERNWFGRLVKSSTAITLLNSVRQTLTQLCESPSRLLSVAINSENLELRLTTGCRLN